MIVHACVHLRFFLILHMFNILITYYAQVFPHDLSYAVCINFNPFCFVLYSTCVPCMVSVDEIIILFISHIGSEERSSMRTIPRISWVGRLIINHTRALQSAQYNNLQLLRVRITFIHFCVPDHGENGDVQRWSDNLLWEHSCAKIWLSPQARWVSDRSRYKHTKEDTVRYSAQITACTF